MKERDRIKQQTTPMPGVECEADLFIAGARRSGEDEAGSLLHVPRHRGHTVTPGVCVGGVNNRLAGTTDKNT